MLFVLLRKRGRVYNIFIVYTETHSKQSHCKGLSRTSAARTYIGTACATVCVLPNVLLQIDTELLYTGLPDTGLLDIGLLGIELLDIGQLVI